MAFLQEVVELTTNSYLTVGERRETLCFSDVLGSVELLRRVNVLTRMVARFSGGPPGENGKNGKKFTLHVLTP